MRDELRQVKTFSVALAAAVLALVLAFGFAVTPPRAYADDGLYAFDPTDNWTVGPSPGIYNSTEAFGFVDEDGFWVTDAKVTDVKSSNKKVAKATVSEAGNAIWVDYGQKTGSATISCKVNGQLLTHKFTVRYTCPVKKFKVGKVNALKTLKKKNTFVTKKVLKKQKLQVKAKKGWVITKVETQVGPKDKVKSINNKTSLSMKVTIKNPLDSVQVTFRNKKTGEEQTLAFQKYWDMRYAAGM